MTMLALLEECVDAREGAMLEVRKRGEEDSRGYHMVLQFGDDANGGIETIVAVVGSAAALEDGATWLLGQLAVLELGRDAASLSEKSTRVYVAPCPHCKGDYLSLDCGNVAERTHRVLTTGLRPAATGAGIELTVLADRLADGTATNEEAIEDIQRLSRLLLDTAAETDGDA